MQEIIISYLCRSHVRGLGTRDAYDLSTCAWKCDCPYCSYRQGRAEKKQREMLVSVAGVSPCVAPDPDPEPGRSTAFRFTLREILYRYMSETGTRMERLRGRLRGEGM